MKIPTLWPTKPRTAPSRPATPRLCPIDQAGTRLKPTPAQGVVHDRNGVKYPAWRCPHHAELFFLGPDDAWHIMHPRRRCRW